MYEDARSMGQDSGQLLGDQFNFGHLSPSLDVVMAADALLRLPDARYSALPANRSSTSVASRSTVPILQAQRRISFDFEGTGSHYSTSSSPGKSQAALELVHAEANYNEPIDYSQLSSRRKNVDLELKTDLVKVTSKSAKGASPPVESLPQPITHSSSLPGNHRFEFILSPQIRPDGKLDLPLSQSSHTSGSQSHFQQYHSYKMPPTDHQSRNSIASQQKSYNLDNRSSTNNIYLSINQPENKEYPYPVQSSPMLDGPASPDSGISETSPIPRHYSRKLIDVDIDEENMKDDAETIYKKMAYHPKLKYLLAASQRLASDSGGRKKGTKQARRSSLLDATETSSNLPRFSQLGQLEHVNEEVRNTTSATKSNSRDDDKTQVRELFIYRDFFTGSSDKNNSNGNNNTGLSENLKPPKKQQASQEPISSIIAQLNHISEVTSMINPSSIHQTKGSKLSNNLPSTLSSQININNHPSSFASHSSPSPQSAPSSLPTSFSSSITNNATAAAVTHRQTKQNSGRDQHSSALTELLFHSPTPSTSNKPLIDPYACADCGKRYSTSSNLARHRQTHRSVCDKKARKCPHCDKVYVSMPAFSMHVRTHNQGCECPHCGKKFSRPWLLQGHIRTHTGEKPFGCPQCGKSFADKSNLRAHVQTHSTEKPYVCGRCGKAFALKSYLYKHEESSCMRGQRYRH